MVEEVVVEITTEVLSCVFASEDVAAVVGSSISCRDATYVETVIDRLIDGHAVLQLAKFALSVNTHMAGELIAQPDGCPTLAVVVQRHYIQRALVVEAGDPVPVMEACANGVIGAYGPLPSKAMEEELCGGAFTNGIHIVCIQAVKPEVRKDEKSVSYLREGENACPAKGEIKVALLVTESIYCISIFKLAPGLGPDDGTQILGAVFI